MDGIGFDAEQRKIISTVLGMDESKIFSEAPTHMVEPLTEAEIASLLVALERSTEMSGSATLDRDEKSAAEKLRRAFDPVADGGFQIIGLDTDPWPDR